jgi:AcrR family transcriptional regulator
MNSYIPQVFLLGSDHYDCHMAQARKKSTPATPAPKKPRLSQAEATARMLNATIQLLLKSSPAEVTVVRICEKAGVHTDYVVRYFGSREELLSQAVEAAFLGFFVNTESDASTRLNLVLESDDDAMRLAKVRMQTITYLLGCGVSPERFQANQKLVLESVFAQSTSNTQVGDRTSKTLILIGTLIVQAMNVLDEVNDISDQQKQDVLAYIGYMSQTGEAVQAALGWDKPVSKKRR